MNKEKRKFIHYVISDVVFTTLLIISIIYKDKVRLNSYILGLSWKIGDTSLNQNAKMQLYFAFLGALVIYLNVMVIIYLKSKFERKDEENFMKADNALGLFAIFLKGMSALFFASVFLVCTCRTSGPSMSPTIPDGSTLLLDTTNNVSNNDVIIFNAEKYTGEAALYAKRVVASPSDTVRYDKSTKTIYVNDEVVYDSLTTFGYYAIYKSYTLYEGTSGTFSDSKTHSESIRENLILSNVEYEFTMPKDKYIVFGDNRDNSTDSRAFGLIEKEDIYAKAVYLLSEHTKL